MQKTEWNIRIKGDGEEVLITGHGEDPHYPGRVTVTSRGERAARLAEEIRSEVLYPPVDIKWMLHSENDLYGWYDAAGSVIDRRRSEGWVIEHDLP